MVAGGPADNYSDLVLVAHPSLQANNVKELLAFAKDDIAKWARVIKSANIKAE